MLLCMSKFANMGRVFIFCFYFQRFKNIAQTSSILLFWQTNNTIVFTLSTGRIVHGTICLECNCTLKLTPQNFGRWDVFIAVQNKNRRCAIFLKKTKFKFTAKFKFSSVPVTQTSFDKRLNDWSIENESKNSACLRVKTLSSSVLMQRLIL
jgi:hypothetical protein